MTIPSRANMIQGQERSIPHRCPICATEPESYSGKLVFPGEEAPMCDNHKKALKDGRLTERQVTMVPVVKGRQRATLDFGMRLLCARQGGYTDRARDWCSGHKATA